MRIKTVVLKHLFIVLAAGAFCSCANDFGYSVAEDGESAGGRLPAETQEIVPGWIRIKLSGDASPLKVGEFTRGECKSGNALIDDLAAGLGATGIRRVFSDGGKYAERRRRYGLHLWYDVRFDEEVPVSRAQAGFASLESVECVEPIYRKHNLPSLSVPADALYSGPVACEADLPFDDPMLPRQWHYHSDGSITGCRTGADINLFEGWKTTAGHPEVIVAVMDSGVQFDHEDLADNMWINAAEFNGTEGIDDDGNGYVDDVYGWNYESMSGTIVPEKHGTHVAGTVAAVNGNGTGVCGVAGGSGNSDGVKIMSLQIFQNDKSEGMNGPDAYAYAADNGAVLSQNSWTWNGLHELPESYSDAFDYFIDNAGMDGEGKTQTGPMRGGVIICATGNSGGPIEYPAADPRTVAVTAMGSTFNLESYSNRGASADIMAPGGVRNDNTGGKRGVLSTSVENGYVAMWGTSMACPHVSGVAALIVSHYGVEKEGFTAADCRELLLRSYKPMGGLMDDLFLDQVGVGLLDAAAAFVSDPGLAPQSIAEPQAQAEQNVIKMSWIAPADGNGNAVASFDVECRPKGAGENLQVVLRNFYDPGSRAQYSVPAQYNTDYDISVISMDRFGNVSGPVAFGASVGNFENRAPYRTDEKFADVTMPDTSAESAVRMDLTAYFADPDLEYGDVLVYSAVSSREGVVGATIDGNVLLLNPLAKGTSLITVTATDLAGDSVNAVMYATVASGDDPVTEEGISVYPNPAVDYLSIVLGGIAGEGTAEVVVYDAAARKTLERTVDFADGAGRLDVSGLVPGIYTVSVKHAGRTFTATFMKS